MAKSTTPDNPPDNRQAAIKILCQTRGNGKRQAADAVRNMTDEEISELVKKAK